MALYDIKDWNGDEYLSNLKIETDATAKQLRRIKNTTNILWHKQEEKDIKFLDCLENSDWNEIFELILNKLNIPYSTFEVENIL